LNLQLALGGGNAAILISAGDRGYPGSQLKLLQG